MPDVHGCPQFLVWVDKHFSDRSLILLGDLIHRGPDSRTCLQMALAWAEAGRATLLWGNHEYWVWDEGLRLEETQREDWFRSEEAELVSQYEDASEGLPELIRDMERFALLARPYCVEGEMLCAHAARPSLGLTADNILDNGYIWDSPELGLHPLPTNFFPALTYSVHGHSILKEPVVDLNNDHVVYLDLGSSKTVRFCVWDAENKRIIFYDD
ncbi:metallophosphoesterase [Deinococcus detaillensis]|uniref:metallophosphoesterase n=1 Tax=Deinococcus detaillensis TaxID=2592048 RepID=UPI001CDB62E0|nr:metallophosphoesterase [Deinococcus detaillensis]